MGFHVLAFEPVFENLLKICEGIYFNRVADLVTLFEAAASDHLVYGVFLNWTVVRIVEEA
ncbi:hypothetical protein A2U01_0060823 [Trifolium medium]|uniref:Uncharacterized protein n=1 Tax=Trifolium medium TaxID=97028 RepID=A0A392RSG8_9FABA|nr:hypothetical protein [Trifolium medium]